MVLWSSAPKGGTRPRVSLPTAIGGLLDVLVPPLCPSCGTRVLGDGALCGGCFTALRFIVDPCCDGCGLPFSSYAAAGSTRRCSACLQRQGALDRVRAMLLYDAAARRLILPFKHRGATVMARVLAPGMAQAGRALLRDAEVIVPVPLHRTRLFRRGYNQAGLLAVALGRLGEREVSLDALRRSRATPSLDSRAAAERSEILRGAIEVRAPRRHVVQGRRVLLVDDVMTSGATAQACAEVLRDAGATGVDALMVARVPLPA